MAEALSCFTPATCRGIVERHGGQLAAHSDGKSGALFQFSLPTKPKNGEL